MELVRKQMLELDELFLKLLSPPDDFYESEAFIYETEQKMLSGIRISEEELENYRNTMFGLHFYKPVQCKILKMDELNNDVDEADWDGI